MSNTTITLFCQNRQSPHTARNSEYTLNRFASWLESQHSITDLEHVQSSHIIAYRQHLESGGLSPASVARALECIRSFFRWAAAADLIERDPAKLVKSPRATLNREPSYLELDEVRALFDVVGQSRNPERDTAMLWCLSLGLRVSEVCGLDVGDVVQPDNGNLGGLVVDGKRAYQRIVPLAQRAYTAIADYISTRGNVSNDAALFVGTWGGDSERRLTTRAVQKWFGGLAESAMLPDDKQHCHAARHGAAMRWLYQSSTPGGIYTVSRLMGHSSIQTTQRYLHVGPQGRAAMAEAIATDPLAA